MSFISVSRIKISIELKGKGLLEAELVRHLAPVSVGTITRALPLEGRVVRDASYISILTNLSIGAEKQREEFKRGEIAYMIANNTICIFTKDAKVKGLNPIGRVLTNIEVMEKAINGDVIVMSLSL